MGKVKLGLIGAGWIAKQHLEVIKDISGMEIVGITSRTRSKAEALAAEYNINICADTIEEMVCKAKPDALMVLVSEDQMFDVTDDVIKYGLPLFIEKPAGLLPEENWELACKAREHGLASMVGFNRRYYSIFEKGIKIIKDHGLLMGVVVEGHERMWRIHEGGKFSPHVLAQWIFANSTHTIDLLRYFGGEASNVMSIAHRYSEPRGDQFAAIMELGSGAIGQYNAHWYSPGGWRVVLYGQGVTVEFKPLESALWIDKSFNVHEIEPDEIDKKYKPGFYRQMEAFMKLVSTGKMEWPMLDLEGAYKTMQLAEKLSSNVIDRTGNQVK
ncbi:MAG: Gfo/Idh/MocA family oxidoreductase [Candidatus Margulisiibacteriota bacterium]